MDGNDNQGWLLEMLDQVSREVDSWEDWRKPPDLVAAKRAREAREEARRSGSAEPGAVSSTRRMDEGAG